MGTTEVGITDEGRTDVNITDIGSTPLCHNLSAVVQKV